MGKVNDFLDYRRPLAKTAIYRGSCTVLEAVRSPDDENGAPRHDPTGAETPNLPGQRK